MKKDAVNRTFFLHGFIFPVGLCEQGEGFEIGAEDFVAIGFEPVVEDGGVDAAEVSVEFKVAGFKVLRAE